MGIISNLTEACSEPTNEIIINNKNKVNKMNNKDIFYLILEIKIYIIKHV